MMPKIKGKVKIGADKELPINPETLPLNTTIEELAEICCTKGVRVTITLKEK